MSYCRWSTPNCDLYCYWHVDGTYSTNVATQRWIGKGEWTWARGMDDSNYQNIGLPHDGEEFRDPTLKDMLTRVLSLRDQGYEVPDHVIKYIRKEIKKAERAKPKETA